jgi:ketosteroid isomerase-like protein
MSTSAGPAGGLEQQAALEAHVAAENRHDLDALMATFAPDAVMEVNARRFDSPDAIRAAHESLGFGEGGAVSQLRVAESRRSFTADGIVVEGTIVGRHTGEFAGRAPSGREVVMPYCVIYQFDAAGLLHSERAYLDTSALLAG